MARIGAFYTHQSPGVTVRHPQIVPRAGPRWPRSFWRAKAPLLFRRKPFVAWVKKESSPRWGQAAPGSVLSLARAAIHIRPESVVTNGQMRVR